MNGRVSSVCLGRSANCGPIAALSQVAAGMAHLHDIPLLHRDLKSDNVLVSGDRAVVADFGTSRQLRPAPPPHVLISSFTGVKRVVDHVVPMPTSRGRGSFQMDSLSRAGSTFDTESSTTSSCESNCFLRFVLRVRDMVTFVCV